MQKYSFLSSKKKYIPKFCRKVCFFFWLHNKTAFFPLLYIMKLMICVYCYLLYIYV